MANASMHGKSQGGLLPLSKCQASTFSLEPATRKASWCQNLSFLIWLWPFIATEIVLWISLGIKILARICRPSLQHRIIHMISSFCSRLVLLIHTLSFPPMIKWSTSASTPISQEHPFPIRNIFLYFGQPTITRLPVLSPMMIRQV